MTLTLKLLGAALIAAIGAAALPASAGEAEIRKAVSDINSKAVVKKIRRDYPIKGMNEVIADASAIYVSDDGRYVFYGALLDFKEKKNLSELALGSVRVDALKSIPDAWKISYEPAGGKAKARVTVFTDISCGYCQKFHSDHAGYLEHGIAIDYVPFPRGGTSSEVAQTMSKIWCAKDKAAAYTDAVNGKPVTADQCDAPIAAAYKLGDDLSVDGTPAVFAADGRKLGGYLPPIELARELGLLSTSEAGGAKTASK